MLERCPKAHRLTARLLEPSRPIEPPPQGPWVKNKCSGVAEPELELECLAEGSVPRHCGPYLNTNVLGPNLRPEQAQQGPNVSGCKIRKKVAGCRL